MNLHVALRSALAAVLTLVPVSSYARQQAPASPATAAASAPISVDATLTAGWSGYGGQPNANLGRSVSTAGDVNGDGYSDVIVGAPLYDNVADIDEGRVVVYYGSPTGPSPTPSWTADSHQTGAFLGFSAGTAGDVNGDGYDDIIVGAFQFDNPLPNEGKAWVYLGSPTGLSATPAWTGESDQANANYGWRVGTAGDVNGDGYDDIFVTAYAFDNGETDEGRVYVYFGSPSGPAVPAWTAEGNQAGANFGYSAGTAGDVNKDGYSDIIIGAQNYDNGQTDEGRAFVYYGGPAGLAGSPGWTAESNQAGALFGNSVSAAGDINGDGCADLLVGARNYANGAPMEGGVFIYLGHPAGPDLSPTWTLEHDQPAAAFSTVATAGDVNGDGYADIVIGADNWNHGQAGEGAVFVYPGSSAGPVTSAVWSYESDQASAALGSSVGTAGDVNGDGYSDVIVGAPLFDNTMSNEGRASVFQGTASGLASSAGWTAAGGPQNREFGFTLSSAGDVNGDGYSDVIVDDMKYTGPEALEGAVVVYHGKPGGLESTPAWSVEGNLAGAGIGYDCGTAGDVNGDGYGDVIIDSPTYSNGQTREGRALVYLGSPSGLSTTPAWSAEGDLDHSLLGLSVSAAGDVNGDGYSDVIVGAPGEYSYPGSEGRALVYLGSPSGLGASPAWTFQGSQVNGLLGYSVSAAGDVNGDGFSDVVVGAPGNVSGQTGLLLVFHGSASGLGQTPALSLPGVPCECVGPAGDVNGDGFSDVVCADPDYMNFYSHEGTVWLFNGSSTGLQTTASWKDFGSQSDAYLGCPCETAGDVNGDGFSDIIIGAAEQVSPWRKAEIHYGSPSGPPLSPNWFFGTSNYVSDFGVAAGAGDVNGDGFSDVMVGAPYMPPAGAAYLWYGNGGAGLGPLPQQVRVNSQAPISLLCRSDSENSFRLQATARTPAGRSKVRLQYEIKPFGSPFNGTGLVTGPLVDSGAQSPPATLSQTVSGLTPGSLYHWRARLLSRSPFFPTNRWYVHPLNAATEADLRTGPSTSGIEETTAPEVTRLHLGPGAPNPFSRVTRFDYTLPERGRVHIAVYDVAGRERRVLDDGIEEAGRHSETWDGDGSGGEKLPAGAYFIRVQDGDIVESRKVLLVR